MLSIKETFISNSANRPQRKLSSLKGIIIHWTANAGHGSDADNHFRYFQNHAVQASAHFFVDDHQIVQIIPEDEVAYHVGARSSRYTDLARQIMGNEYSPNNFLIGIEMCVNVDGDWDKTYQHTIELTRHLMTKYGLTSDQVWRHFDITGKDCPKMMTYSEDEGWQRFKQILDTGNFPDESQPISTGVVNVSSLSVRTGNGPYFREVRALAQGTSITIYEEVGTWYRIGNREWVAKQYVIAPYTATTNTRKGSVNASSLNVRSGPSTMFGRVDRLNRGEEVIIYSEDGDWYHIGENRWVHKDFISVGQDATREGIVLVTKLNVRKGAGTNQPIVGSLSKNELVSIFEERNGWLKIGDDKWVSGAYISEKINRTGKVTVTSLNVRSGPGTSFSKVGSLGLNDTIEVLAEEGSWFQIKANEWVHRNFVRLDEN
ncbi:MAG: SH3 domain-containing protein [Crocinitomicaceae bacterium]